MTHKGEPQRRSRSREGAGARLAVMQALLTMASVVASQQGIGALAQSADDHPYFAEEYEITEGRGDATISVVRDSGAGSVKVTFATKPSDATEGADYLPVRGEMTFASGEQGPKTFRVPIVDDTEPEEDETVLLLLYNSAAEAIDFSEVVIQSDEAAVEDPDEGPGSQSGNSPDSPRPETGQRPGTQRSADPVANASPGTPSGPALAPGEIPTILLEPATDASEQSVARKGRKASPGTGKPASSRSVMLLFALSAAGLACGLAALFWLRVRQKAPPTS